MGTTVHSCPYHHLCPCHVASAAVVGHAVVISVGEGGSKNQTGRQADQVKEVESRTHHQHLQSQVGLHGP